MDVAAEVVEAVCDAHFVNDLGLGARLGMLSGFGFGLDRRVKMDEGLGLKNRKQREISMMEMSL